MEERWGREVAARADVWGTIDVEERGVME